MLLSSLSGSSLRESLRGDESKICIFFFPIESIFFPFSRQGRAEIGGVYSREHDQVTMKGLDNFGAAKDD